MDTCRDISLLVSRSLDARLSAGERLRVRLHLMLCRGCRQFELQVRLLRRASRALGRRALGVPATGSGQTGQD